MNRKFKYSSIFLVFTLSLILASGIIAAADVDNNNNIDLSDNTITNTVGDDAVSTPQTTDNNIESQTIKEVDDTYNDTKTASDENKLVKEDKNIKKAVSTGTLTLTPDNGYPGDTIAVHLTGGATSFGSSGSSHILIVKLDGVTVINGHTTPVIGRRVADTNITVPNYEPGTYTMEVTIGTDTNWAARGTATFTIKIDKYESQLVETGTVTGEVDNTIVPITITKTDGSAITGSSTVTIKDGDTILVENYPIENGEANVPVPTRRAGDYDLTVLFAGTNYYLNCTGTIPVSISKAGTTLTVDQYDDILYEVINAFENTVLTGSLVQTSNNKPLKDAQLTVTVDGTDYTITTDDEGKYVYKHTVTQIGDSIPISIVFNGDDLYSASQEITGELEIETLEVNIALDEVTLSEVNETTTISGTITDNYDHLIPNAEVELQINNGEAITVTTDNEGKFAYNIEFNEVMDVAVEASMKNQAIYEAETATTTFTVVVGPKRTNLTIETGSGVGTTININDVTPYFNEVITNGTLIDIFSEPVADANIKILINGEDYSQTTDNEGKFTLVYNATEGLTTYDISVEFEGNDAYKPAGEVYTGTFKTEAFDITVTVDDNFPEEILVGDTVTITGSATLQNETLKNNPIVLTIDGRNYNSATDDEGKFTYEYTVTRIGGIPLIANATFDNADVKVARKTINVAYPTVNVDLDEVNDTIVLANITLNGRVYIAQNSTPIEDNLLFKINGQTYPLATNEDGYFTYTFTPDAIGIYEISVAYGSMRYNVQNATATINVAKRTTQLTNDQLPIAVKVNDIFTISGTLTDQTGSTISDAEVIFIINNEIFTNTTDTDGRYQYNYQTTTVSDNNQYEVRYSGDEKYVLAKNYVGSFFDVETTNAYISIDDTEATLNVPTSITGKVTEINNKGLENVNVKIQVNDEEFENTTDSEGTYTITYTPTKIGKYTVVATIDDENYSPKTATKEFEANKGKTTITINPVKVTPTMEANLTANVVDSNNNPVNAGKVVFKINGKTVKDANGKVTYTKLTNGQATITHTFTKEDIDKNVSISAAYSGTTSYDSSTSDKVQIIKSDDHNLTITVEDITAAQEQTITITATLKDYNDNVNTGKVLFKINGKTIKDSEGKVLYAQVQDGIASVEYTVPTTTKPREYTLTAVFMDSFYNKTETNAILTITEKTEETNETVITNNTNETIITNNTNITNINTTNNLKTESGNVIVITGDNVDEYIKANGLTDLVNPGDTLDIQGLIDRQHSLVINKPVNVISSTQDAVISLHTVAGSLMGEDPGNCFVVNKAGSYSNISNLYLNNTECWIFNTHDVTLHNMTMHVKDARVGSGVGQTAIRYCENITIDSCYIYTENNGGSTSMALTGTSNAIIKNTTIEGVHGSGQVGNILYLGNRNNLEDKPSDVTLGTDNNITVINCTLTGECTQSINVMTFYGSVDNVSFINNTLNASGNYASIQIRHGVASGNKVYQSGTIIVQADSEAYDNVFYGNGQMTTYANVNVYNNTLYTLEYAATGNVHDNTIKALKLYSNTELSGNIINGSISIASTSSNRISNVVLSNNTMTGNVEITGTLSRKTDNLQLIDNDITGNVTLTYAQNTKLINNTINGTVNIASAATGTNIENNTIVTSNPYAISNAATSTVVSNNYLISDNYQKIGADAISDTGRINTADNGPEISDFWTLSIDHVYATVADETTITVQIVDEINGNPIEEGEVYLMINDEILTDEEGNVIKADVSSSQAYFDINSIPTEWLRSDAILTAVFTSGEITKICTDYMTILKRDANVEITTEELTINAGQSVTLTARVTDIESEELLNGKVAFKLDGCSLEDSQDSLIYVDVVDGIATLEYTFGDNITPDTYTLSAVFENMYYNRANDDKTLVIE